MKWEKIKVLQFVENFSMLFTQKPCSLLKYVCRFYSSKIHDSTGINFINNFRVVVILNSEEIMKI